MKFFYIILISVMMLSCNSSESGLKSSNKVVIAHRGASGYLPEHTMEAKVMAYQMGADYIEQDLVLSKDDVPIVIHDIYLDDITDVATKFPDRKRDDNRYYVIDFTFKELKTLSVTERFDPKTGQQFYPNRFPKGKGCFSLHSLQEEIELIQGLNKVNGTTIGIYPEIKAPSFHKKEGKQISEIVLDILSNYGYQNKNDKCILQCFDADELKRIRENLKSDLFLVQLIHSKSETEQLNHFATYADGIGPWYRQLLKEKNENGYEFTNLVKDAHQLGLVVHPYTLRADALDTFLDFDEMIETILIRAKADGAFTDFPDKVIRYLNHKSN